MRILILILAVTLCGCASVDYRNLRPKAIYTLEDGSKIKVYKTIDEIIYIKGESFSATRSK